MTPRRREDFTLDANLRTFFVAWRAENVYQYIYRSTSHAVKGERMKIEPTYRMYYVAPPEELEEIADTVEEVVGHLDQPQYHTVLHILAQRRPWRPRHTGWVNVIDQILHFGYAVIVFLPLMIWPSWYTAAAGGLLLGAIREWEQWKELDLKIPMIPDRLQDVLFFGIGAVALYFIINAFVN